MKYQQQTITNQSENVQNKFKLTQLQQFQIANIQKCYGKMHVFFFRKKHILSLGPDWFCFVFAFITFSTIGFFLTRYTFTTGQHFIFCYFTLFFSIFQSFSYFMAATMDPGVIIPGTQQIPDNNQEIKKFCKRCGMYMIRKSFHCKECDVCIKEYDHHCPWVSKCIGKNNLKFFYAFVASTPLFLLYAMITFMYIIAAKTVQQNKESNVGKLLLL